MLRMIPHPLKEYTIWNECKEVFRKGQANLEAFPKSGLADLSSLLEDPGSMRGYSNSGRV